MLPSDQQVADTVDAYAYTITPHITLEGVSYTVSEVFLDGKRNDPLRVRGPAFVTTLPDAHAKVAELRRQRTLFIQRQKELTGQLF